MKRYNSKLRWAGCIACFALAAIDLVYTRHVNHAVEGWLGFYPLFGFAASVIFIVLAKIVRALLKRPEDYYDD